MAPVRVVLVGTSEEEVKRVGKKLKDAFDIFVVDLTAKKSEEIPSEIERLNSKPEDSVLFLLSLGCMPPKETYKIFVCNSEPEASQHIGEFDHTMYLGSLGIMEVFYHVRDTIRAKFPELKLLTA